MGSRSGFDADLDLAELQNPTDIGSGLVPVGTRLTNALTNLGQQTLVNNAGVVGLSNSSTSAQDLFGAGKQVTLQPNTVYIMECHFLVSTGTTSHTDALGFVFSTAPVYIRYVAYGSFNVLGTISTTFGSVVDVSTANATVVTGAQTTNTLQTLDAIGTFKTGATLTTMRPQVTFSAGPTGTCQLEQGSYMLVWPVISQ